MFSPGDRWGLGVELTAGVPAVLCSSTIYLPLSGITGIRQVPFVVTTIWVSDGKDIVLEPLSLSKTHQGKADHDLTSLSSGASLAPSFPAHFHQEQRPAAPG